jgi:hypothetical protein
LKKTKAIICAFIAALGLNVNLSATTPLDDFRIEGYPLMRYQEVNGNLSGKAVVVAEFFAGFSGNSVLWLGVFVALCFLFLRAGTVTDLRIGKYSTIAAAMFALLYVVGFSINKYGSLDAISGSVTNFLKCVVAFTGIMLVFKALLVLLFEKIIHGDLGDAKTFLILETGRKAFFCRFAIILICWLPYLIVYLPGFLVIDTISQINEGLGVFPLTALYPILTSFLFSLFFRFGMLFNYPNIGVLLYSLFQMAVCAAAFSYVLHRMAKNNIHTYVRVATLLFFALYPVNGFYAITMWKDTLFGVVIMLLVLETICMAAQPETFFGSKKNMATYAVLCIALYLTRNNGLHIILLLLPVLLLVFRKYWKNVLALIAAFAICLISMQAISTLLDVQKGSVKFALAIPLQQVARTVKGYGDELSADDRAIISSVLNISKLAEKYDPFVVDPIIADDMINEDGLRSDPGLYLSLWARLLAKYPRTYIVAFLAQTHGYWYPDIDEWLVARVIAENDYGLHHERIVPNLIDNAFSGIFVFRVFPAVSMLVSIGFAVWVAIIMALALMIKKQYRLLVAFVPVLLLWLTCIASPVSGQYRYIYGLFLALPLFISLALQNEKWQDQTSVSSAAESQNGHST